MLKQVLTIVLALLAGPLVPGVWAEEIGYVEQFALAKDRAEALKQLIPGTEDYYYFSCLHHQQLEQFDRVDELLAAWLKRHGRTSRWQEIEKRQALLTYPRNPQRTLTLLTDQLSLKFDHQRQRLDARPDLPTALDQQLISRERLRALALQRVADLSGFEPRALEWLVATELDPDRRRHLLNRLQRPDYPQLAKLIVDDLNHKYSRGFGSLPIHGQLLQAQLDACLALKPDLRNDGQFVNTYLAKLHPPEGIDWQNSPAEQRAYLDRLWGFVSRLAPVHNSLKAHVLYRRLVLDRQEGKYPRAEFMEYIKLPRQAFYVNPEYLREPVNQKYPCNLGQDFAPVTQLPIVGNDEPLIRSYLHHFFLEAIDYQEFRPYLQEAYLKRNFAEAKIVNGLGDPEQWYSLLSPEEYRQLKDRVDLDFAFTNQKVYQPNDDVRLDVHVKNVQKLIVKVFEINTSSFYRQQLREVNADIDLDGLVPNSQQVHEYQEPPVRRVLRRFDFPQLKKPGVYVVDFIGNGQSSRAVVRKGRFRHLARSTAGGHAFTILDPDNHPLPKATLWLAGREYVANDRGEIVVPYSNRPGMQVAVAEHAGRASLVRFQQQAEQYGLRMAFYVDRETLLARHQAKLFVRAGLDLNGQPVAIDLLEQVQLQITSTDRDGVSSSLTVKEFKLSETEESVYTFQVPPRLAKLDVTLTGQVENLSQSKKEPLSASQSFVVNEIDATAHIQDLHVLRAGSGYRGYLLGKTGEPHPDRAVSLSLKHRDFTQWVDVVLKTDLQGMIDLGPLRDIAALRAVTPEGATRTWTLPENQYDYPLTRHGSVGEVLEFPLAELQQAKLSRADVSLLELRGGRFAKDRFDTLSWEQGLLKIKGLPAGDYQLWLKASETQCYLRITEGQHQAGHVLGANRQLEVRTWQPLQIGAIQPAKEEVRIQLLNATPQTRVHLLATRYVPAYDAFKQFASVSDAAPQWNYTPDWESLFVEGRNIGDEYRYIINRQYAQHYPGNMLQRPSLLLNPWAVRSTETTRHDAEAGDRFAPEAELQGRGGRGEKRQVEEQVPTDFANLDFLPEGSVVLENLRPNDAGVVTIAREKLGKRQYLQILAVDPRLTVSRIHTLDQAPSSESLDLRLAKGLAPDKHYSQQRKISLVPAGKDFTLEDLSSSRFETYDSLSRVYNLFTTLTNDAKLAEFRFVLEWEQLDLAERKEKFSKYACHELSFFLSRKDPKFFETVIQPYLANKRDKTFLDHWLLGSDLSRFTAPWEYAQLNTLERILLSQQVEADRQYTRRDVNDIFALIPPDIERFNRLFETAIQNRGLDPTSAVTKLATVLQRNQLRELAEAKQSKPGFANDFAAAPPAPAMEPAPAPAAATPAPSDRPALAEKEAANRQALKKDKAKDESESLGERRAAKGRELDSKDAYFDRDADLRYRKAVRKYFQALDKTKEWAENNYYHLTIDQQNADLVKVNAFWRDYANHDDAQPFFSENFAEATSNFSEMMLALSVLDLPLTAEEFESSLENTQLSISAKTPLLVFHEEIKPATGLAQDTPILVSQNFYRHGERYRTVNNQKVDNFVTDEFLSRTVYGCQVVVTNPTSTRQRLDVLVQIPVGAMPVAKGKTTRSVYLDLEPFHTQTFDFLFYFPGSGDYQHYPVHVSQEGKTLAFSPPFSFHVVDKLSQIDTQSWAYVSQFGTDQQVIEFLQANNLHEIELQKIAFRMADKNFFRQIIRLLAQRHVYERTLWSYAVKHNEPRVIQEFLQHEDAFVANCGLHLEAPLLTIDPVVRKTYQHLDYRPLVNARAHQLGRKRQILNDRFHAQYHRLLHVLAYQRQLSDEAKLAVTYYLLLQDRVDEAVALFGTVASEGVAEKLQYEYLKSYLAMYQADLETAREISGRHLEHPVPRWRDAFVSIDKQLDEISGESEPEVIDEEDRGQQQTQLASKEPALEAELQGTKVQLLYQNLDRVVVNYYLMDIELLFSRNPFVQGFSGQFAFIKPNLTQTFELPKGDTHQYELPEQLKTKNVLIEIVGGGINKTVPYYANTMNVRLAKNYGQVHVTKADKPVSKVYVKVYARDGSGQVKFYKDGYTDLRGRFDYATLSTNDLDNVQRFAVLVLSPDHGAVVREVEPPKQ